MLTKKDSKQAQGLAILAMLALHLFCRLDMDMYNVHIMIGNVPLLYYIGLFGDICVPIFCFISGYAQIYLHETEDNYIVHTVKRLKRLLVNYWVIVVIFASIGIIKQSSSIPGSFTELIMNLFLIKSSYNGAWWFLLTYILLIVSGKIFFYMIDKIRPWLLIFFSSIVYFVTYLAYFKWNNLCQTQ